MPSRRTLRLAGSLAVVALLQAPMLWANETTLDSGESTATKAKPSLTCEEFVYLDEGRLMLEGQRYELKGVNLALGVGAVATPLGSGQFDFDYFLAPNGNYRPQNYSVPHQSWQDANQGCTDAASCRQMLIDEQIPMLQALGVNSVRLVGLAPGFDPSYGSIKQCKTVWFPGAPPCEMDTDDPVLRAQLVEIIRGAIRLLGAHGIRSILHTSGGDSDHKAVFDDYLDWQALLSDELSSEPYLIAYDPFNEPVYAFDAENQAPRFDNLCTYQPGNPDFCKATAQAVSKEWFDALTSSDPRHLVTIGLGTARNSGMAGWDPWVLYDHFTSYHIYPSGDWDDRDVPGSRSIAHELYYASLSGCGEPCPYGGDFDGANCLVAKAAVGQPGFIEPDDGGFYYPDLSGPNPCSLGQPGAWGCRVGDWEVGRDRPFMLDRPMYYVEPIAGQCPSGTSYDGTGCLVASAPPGAQPFIYTVPGGTFFYYKYLDPNGVHCQPPAWDDSRNCVVAPVPVGYEAFVESQTLFYVEPVTCGPRKPLHLGETGLSSMPNGFNLEWPDNQHSTLLENEYRLCHPCLNTRRQIHGTDADQVDYLLGGLTAGWPGVVPYSHACGFQGLHWWQLADVKWGLCTENNYGLFTYCKKRRDDNTCLPEEMVPKAAVTPFASQIDFTASPSLTCDKPSDFHRVVDPNALQPRYRLVGRVKQSDGSPVANAPVASFEAMPHCANDNNNWRGQFRTFTDADGRYVMETEHCLATVSTTHFGYTHADDATGWSAGNCPAPTANGLVHLTGPTLIIDPLPTTAGGPGSAPAVLDPLADFDTPSTRVTACRIGNDWVVLP